MTNLLYTYSVSGLSNDIDSLLSQSWAIRNANTLQALETGQKALLLSQKSDYKKGIATAYKNMAVCNQLLGNYDESVQQCFDALPLYESLADQQGEAAVYSCIGTCFFMMNDHENSLLYHLKALTIRESLHLPNEKASSLLNIANVYASLKDFNNALKYYSQSEKIAEQLEDKMILSRIQNGLGGVYSSKGEYNRAIDFFLKSLTHKTEIGDERSIASTLNNMGDCYIAIHDYESAQRCLVESMKIALEYGDKLNEAAYLRGIGKLFLAQGKYNECIEQIKRALLLYESLKNAKDKVYCYKLLSDAYTMLGDYRSALNATNTHYMLKEEVFGQETSQRIENINLLRQMEQIKNESEIQQLKTVELKKAYQQIEEKNKNILDSIQYAQYLQQVLLPSEKNLHNYLPNSFVFFKPKDIVSGDFLWVHRLGDEVLLAVVDCTGHGVPGAFMSLVSNNMLNAIVKDRKVTDPALILSELNNQLVQTFAHSDESIHIKSGLDIGICLIHPQNKTVSYAGARNTMYIIAQHQLTEIKAERVSMGVNANLPFKRTDIQLNTGDCLYMFTDGYADQKGGEERKKLFYQPFQYILSDVANLSMDEQKTALDFTMKEWMKNEEQTDDMMVVGIKM